MKRRQQISQPNHDTTFRVEQYHRLENRLILLAWLNDLLGYSSNRALLEDCKNVAEGFHEDGRSFLYYHLISRGKKVKISAKKLAKYDKNIRLHLEKINRGRTEKITLRYFQHLAALYTEIILDRLFNAKAALLKKLNAFVDNRNRTLSKGSPPYEKFTENDLTKLAFWMATGSGKTLLLHLNYYQFLHYNCDRKTHYNCDLNNILLITPNEGLSEQHIMELRASGIPAQRFDPQHSSQHTVQVIEITKLVEEKRGGGVSVSLDSFQGRNLIFVDEGHKGSGGETWRRHREALGATGFTFEYSATFGQALSAARNDPLTAEYGKAIIFDYSYKYFYGDGFGKDFRILNLKDETDDERTDLLLLGNLLSFYEQVRLFEEQNDVLRPYNLEKPLWVFVGSTVNAVYTDNKKPRSDVLTVVRFLHRVLSDRNWAVEGLKVILDGKTGLVDQNGADIFAGRFPCLKEKNLTSETLYNDILKCLFHAPASGGLHLCSIKSSPDELGLKAAGAKDYFGLIYIGDTAAFKKLAEEGLRDIVFQGDAISASLFEHINLPNSGIHVLIGAKKFMEGWNSWRVASMGLLNIGKNEGAQIIQLFGRGVRLKGKDMCLKRSSVLEGTHPKHIRLLETLNIFAVRANYMAQFRNYLEREGVEVELPIELSLPVRINKQFLQRGLVVPRPPENRDFKREASLLLKPNPSIAVQVDLSVKMETIESMSPGSHAVDARSGQERHIPTESLLFVDWQQVYLDVLAYKRKKGIPNLIIHPVELRSIIQSKGEQGVPLCQLIADERVFSPRTFADRALLQEAVTRLLCRYIDRFYQVGRERWEEANLVYQELNEHDPNLSFGKQEGAQREAAYTVRISASEGELIKAIRELLGKKKKKQLYNNTDVKLPRINFCQHIYVPLLLEKEGLHISPPALNKSEKRFVEDLREYWDKEKDKSLARKKIFLLRNLSRGRGIGFFETRGFYPDFILWVKHGHTQRVVFIEPHGMLHAKPYIHDGKARLHERLPKLAEEIGKRSGKLNVYLDAFIISATSYEDLCKHYDNGTWTRDTFRDKHILFPIRDNTYDYIKIILSSEDASAFDAVS